MTTDFAALVLGGGPAGTICALRLADLGLSTLLVDKATFPRAKVCGCCLNLASAGILKQVGLGELPQTLGAVPLHDWQARWGTTKVDAPLPGGWALSRYRLDEALLGSAAAAGAKVRTATVGTVEAIADGRVSVRLRNAAKRHADEGEIVTAAVAVVATGLGGGGVEQWLPYQRRPGGPLGVGFTVQPPDDTYPPGTIYMACGADGYVGMVRLEDGRLDVAAALMPARLQANVPGGARGAGRQGTDSSNRSSRSDSAARESLPKRMFSIIDEAGFPSTRDWRYRPEEVQTTPRLQRARQAGCGRLIAVGDAAGYVEPFTGEGMAWGMASGLAAADTLAESLPGQPEQLGQRWIQVRQKLLRRRQWPCRLLAATLRSDFGRRSLFHSLHRMPWLAKPVIQYLN